MILFSEGDTGDEGPTGTTPGDYRDTQEKRLERLLLFGRKVTLREGLDNQSGMTLVVFRT